MSADSKAAAVMSPESGVFKFVGGLVLGFVLRSLGSYILDPQVRPLLVCCCMEAARCLAQSVGA